MKEARGGAGLMLLSLPYSQSNIWFSKRDTEGERLLRQVDVTRAALSSLHCLAASSLSLCSAIKEG